MDMRLSFLPGQIGGGDLRFCALADNVEPALQLVLRHSGRAANEDLLNVGLRGARDAADGVDIHRCVAPAQNGQPFFADDKIAQQSYPSSEPYQALQKGVPVNFYLFADYGYPPYGTTIVTTNKFLSEHPDILGHFVKASMEGWKGYLKGDPAPANKLIQADNPNMSDGQIAFGIKRLNELQIVDGGDAKTMGIGIMTEARWKQTYDLMVASDLLPKDTDWHKAFTTQFVKDLKIMW